MTAWTVPALPLGATAALTWAVAPLARRPAARAGLSSRPGGLNPESFPVPLTGGIAVFVGALPLAWTRPHVLPGLAAALAVGIVDDLRGLDAGLRVAAWAAIGAALALGVPHSGTAVAFAAVAAVVLCTGVNLLDGIDGLAAAVVGAGAGGLTFLTASWTSGGRTAATLAVAMAAFLWWNRPPARCYLGNGGASLAGAWLVAAAIEQGAGATHPRSVAGLAWLCALLPCAEVVTTVVRRHRAGLGMVVRERGHGYDQLVGRGVGVGTVSLLYGVVQLVASSAAVAMVWAPHRLAVATIAVAGLGLAALARWSRALRPAP